MSTAPSTALPVASAEPLVDRSIVKAHIIAGFSFFFLSVFSGLFYALQLSRLYPFPGVELLSPGRLRMVHTNAIAYGFLLNNFMAEGGAIQDALRRYVAAVKDGSFPQAVHAY